MTYLKGEQALGIVCTYCQKLSVRAIIWSTRNAALQTELLCVIGKGSGHAGKKQQLLSSLFSVYFCLNKEDTQQHV